MFNCMFGDSVDDIIRLCSFSCHEEEIPVATWQEISSSIRNFFLRLRSENNDFKKMPRRIFLHLLIIAFGTIGNIDSTQKIVNLDAQLFDLADEALRRVATSFNVGSIPELLKSSFESDHRDVVYDLFLQEATRRITHLSNVSDISPLCKGPLFRDALCYATSLVEYPILNDSQQLNILHPLCLQLLEDYRNNIKRIGLKLLTHLGDQFLVSSWRISGRALATVEALKVQRMVSGQHMVGQCYTIS